MGRILTIFFIVWFMVTPSSAQSAGPLEVLRGHIDQVLSILKDPQYQEADKKEQQREKIWEIINLAFDFQEIAKRAVASHWKRFTKVQKDEFSSLFGEFLGNIYLDRLQGDYQGEKIIYHNQKMLTDSKAAIKTTIRRETTDIPAVYSMKNRKGPWRVYDVKIEGVSLVRNYRAQFRKALRKSSPDDLIEMIKKKIEKQKKKRASKISMKAIFNRVRLMATQSFQRLTMSPRTDIPAR